MTATVLFLFALSQGYRYIRFDERPALLRSVALAGAAAGAHHAALLFALFAGAAVVTRALLANAFFNAKAQGRKDAKENFAPSRLRAFALKPLAPPTTRALVWALLSSLAIVVVLWPFLEWSAGYRPQTPIDHASRHNFIADPIVTATFFWPAYGAFLLLVPWAILIGVRLRRLWPLAALTILLFVLGLGGTTPLPRWLFGANWEWLTYDRFALWAAICLLPFGGAAILLLKIKPRSREGMSSRRHSSLVTRHSPMFIVHWTLVIASALYGSLLSVTKPAQPPAVDLLPVAEFLAEGANDQWRYLTLGFGDQAARLATLTTAGTPDGAYHTARELPALRASGLAQLDTVVWQPGGVDAARPFLTTAAADWSVRWVFVNHHGYEPLLRETGWRFVQIFGDGIELWRKDRVWPVAPWRLVKSGPTPAAQWWGIAPLAALCLAVLLGALSDEKLRCAARTMHTFLFYGLILVLPFGWHQVVSLNQSSSVFFTYRSVLVFAADFTLLSLLAMWLIDGWLSGDPLARRRHVGWGATSVGLAGAGLLIAVALSVPRSIDPTLSTAFLLHLALLAGLYLYLQSETPQWRIVAALLMAQLGVQATLGLIEFAAQSTRVIEPLHLPFLAALTPDIPGASVVQTADGTRWLRAYGSLWHPNVLGAVLLVCLAGVLIKGTEGNRGTKGTGISLSSFISLSSLAFTLGLIALALSFSRAAWIGALVAFGVLSIRLPRSELRKLLPVAIVAVVALVAVVIAFRPLFTTRATADTRSPLEKFSIEERASVAEAALHLAREHLWTGVGAGSFVEALAAEPSLRVSREPAHDVPLLVLVETGLPGAVALAALAAAIGWQIIRRRPATPQAHIFTAITIGLLLTSLFDHFLWTSSPGRLLAALTLSLWAAADRESDIL
ncbi:MAG: O-antigen ligase family protein [Chloroflexi bacterium]|nr:O-antigen ligase family protein [Chloroflexota bacterium]